MSEIATPRSYPRFRDVSDFPAAAYLLDGKGNVEDVPFDTAAVAFQPGIGHASKKLQRAVRGSATSCRYWRSVLR